MKKNKSLMIGLGSGLFWGLSTVLLGVVLLKTNIQDTSMSLTTTWLHDSVSAFLLIVVLIVKKRGYLFIEAMKSRSFWIVAVAALLGGPIGMGAYLLSISYLSPALAASISAIYPVFGTLLAFLILKEKITKRQISGLIVSVSAIMLMGMTSSLNVSNLGLGLLTVFLCVIGWGSEAVIVGYAMKEELDSDIALTARQLTSALIYGIVIIPFFGYRSLNNLFYIKNLMFLIAVAGVFGTISYALYYKAISILGATKAMALNITYPVWAFVFQLILFQHFSLTELVLVMVVLLGTYIGIDFKSTT